MSTNDSEEARDSQHSIGKKIGFVVYIARSKNPLTRLETGLLLATYVIGILSITYFGTIYNFFGVIFLTAGGITLTIIHHDKGAITVTNTINKIIYNGMGALFLLAGMRYVLTGLVFEIPI